MTAAHAIVVKLGGSLLGSPQLPVLLRSLVRTAKDGQPVAIVPGGGPFADAVRDAQQRHGFDDDAAHDMALLAMGQYGRLLGALADDQPRLCAGAGEVAVALCKQPQQVAIWSPDPRRDALDVERSWRIGADALALWLARSLGAGSVLLVKSCPPPVDERLEHLAATGVVDAAYAEMATATPAVATTLVYAGNASSLEGRLAARRPSRTPTKAARSSEASRLP
jgi:aspartokinase-like uncharacterized kinase